MRVRDHRPRTTDHGPGLNPGGPFLVALFLALMAPLRAQGTPTDQAAFRRGEAVFKSLCYTCHGADGRGGEKFDAPAGTLMGPPLVGSPRVAGHPDYVVNVLLCGLTGPVEGATYQDAMLPFGSNPDAWIADVATFVRGSFGPGLSPVAPGDVARIRNATGKRAQWTLAELEPRLARSLPSDRAKLSASDTAEPAGTAVQPAGWHSASPAQKDMWLQLELPEPTTLSEVEFVSSAAEGFTLLLSANGNIWTRVATARRLQGWVKLRASQPTSARFVRIVIAAAPPTAPNWEVRSLRVYAAPEK